MNPIRNILPRSGGAPSRTFRPGTLLLRVLLILVLVSTLAPSAAYSQQGDSAALPVWTKYSVDAPAYFTNMTDRSMDFHPLYGAPCIAAGGDALYFICQNGVTKEWVTWTLDNSASVGQYAALRYDNYGQPFITYYDALYGRLKLAYHDGTQWVYLIVPNVINPTSDDPMPAPQADLSLQNVNPPQPADPVDPVFLQTQEPPNAAEMVPPPTGLVASTPSNDEPVVDDTPAQPEPDEQPGILESLQQMLEAALAPLAPNFPIEGALGWGKYSSIDIDRNNGIHITYYDEVEGSLEYQYWNGVVWNGKVVDDYPQLNPPSPDGDTGLWSSVDVDYNFNVHIAYMSDKYDDLRYAKRNATGGWNLTTVDGLNNVDVGAFSSIATDAQFRPHISYYDQSSDRLRYAWKNAAGEWVRQTVDGAGLMGWYTSIAIDANNNVHISYYNASRGDLKYARKAVGTSSTWNITTLDSTSGKVNVGLFTSIAIDDVDNRPGIAYVDATFGGLKFIYNHKNNGWGKGQYASAYISRDVGLATSLAISSSGVPYISYLDATYGSLKLARTFGASWGIRTLISDPWSGMYSSIDLVNGEVPRIAYYEQERRNLMYAQDLGLGFWGFGTLDATGDTGRYVSMELDTANIPHISYHDATRNDLVYASYAVSAGGWYTQTIDFEDSVGWYTDIAVNTANRPYISYYDQSTGSLMAAFKSPATQTWVKLVVDNIGLLPQTGVGAYTAIDVDSIGCPHISYYDLTNKMLKYAYWQMNNPAATACSLVPTDGAWNKAVIDPAMDTGRFSSLKIDIATNTRHVCYYDYTNGNLMYAQGAPGVAWQRQIVDGSTADGDPLVDEGDVGLYCSIDINADGNPGISYYSNSHGDLKYATSYALPNAALYLPLVVGD